MRSNRCIADQPKMERFRLRNGQRVSALAWRETDLGQRVHSQDFVLPRRTSRRRNLQPNLINLSNTSINSACCHPELDSTPPLLLLLLLLLSPPGQALQSFTADVVNCHPLSCLASGTSALRLLRRRYPCSVNLVSQLHQA
jgi:hypothetical protein